MSFPKPTPLCSNKPVNCWSFLMRVSKLHDKGGTARKRVRTLLSPVSNRASVLKMCGAYAVISHTE